MLDTSSDSPEDVLFDNYLKEADVAKLEKAAAKLDLSSVDNVIELLDKVGEPVPSKPLQFLAWRANPHRFHADTYFARLLADGRAAYLSNGTWIGPKAVATLAGFFPALAEREVDEYGEAALAE